MSGIQQFLLPSTNTWTGLNTFQDLALTQQSTSNLVSYPILDQYFTGYVPHGRNIYIHEVAASDNPDALHSSIDRTINRNPFTGTSDDGTGIYIADHLEFRYQGAAVTTITSISVSAGVGTFTVASTTALYKYFGFAVRGNSTSAYNTLWKITAVTDGTHFTAVFSSGTAGTGTGTGGDIRAEANEWNSAASGYRWGYMYSHNGNPTQSGGISFGYPFGVGVPTDFACTAGLSGYAFKVFGDQSQSAPSGGIYACLYNQNATSAASGFVFINDKTGKNVSLVLDNSRTGADDFRILHAANYLLYSPSGGSRVIIAGSTDDGSTKVQLGGNTKVSGNIVGTGNITAASGLIEGNQFQTDTNQILLGSTGGQIQFERTPYNNASTTYSAFTQTANAGPSNTTTETTLVGNGLAAGNINAIPVMKFDRIGKTYRFKMSGFLTNTGTPTLQIKVKVNSTTIFDTTAFTMATVTGNGYWDLQGELTCRSTGVSGTLFCQARLSYYSTATTSNMVTAANTTATTVDISANRLFDITAQWGAASASNVITATNFTLEQVN